MKQLVMILMAGALLLGPAALAEEKTKTAAKAEKAPAGLPAGAKEIAPHKYRYTDAQGKVWIYTKTPFGYSKASEKELLTPAAGEDETLMHLKVRRDGEMVEFERATPFGKSVWKKKASELTDEEKGWLAAREKR